VLDAFAITPDHVLWGESADTLPGSAARVIEGMESAILSTHPDVVVVEGDTTSVYAAALAAFYLHVPVAHVEAGLRSGDLGQPFPEEAHRRMVTVMASLHLAHTEAARRNLLAEGVSDRDIVVTGNPGLDALRMMAVDTTPDDPPFLLVTIHRRESWGEGIETICRAVARIARHGVRAVLPVHHSVEGSVRSILGGVADVSLVEPMPYPDLARLLGRCTLVLTDSGGLQEEGPALGKPVLVLRDTTERPEAIEAGANLLVGRTEDGIVDATLSLLDDPERYARMAVPRPLFGDGHAAPRIVDAIGLTGPHIRA
jgi:UDP-N-acetylglucosamine 2-epimerase (non-hydrolysing)